MTNMGRVNPFFCSYAVAALLLQRKIVSAALRRESSIQTRTETGVSMKLFLVQHGEAKSEEQDPDRSLTDRGIRKTKKSAGWLGRQHFNIGEIVHSGKKRAGQTAEIFAARLAPAKGIAAVPGLNPNDDVLPMAELLADREESLMIVGHLPYLNRLASLLLTGDPASALISFANSGIVCLEREENRWSIGWIVVPDLLPE
jgi:phosphohistidine phosphatase